MGGREAGKVEGITSTRSDATGCHLHAHVRMYLGREQALLKQLLPRHHGPARLYYTRAHTSMIDGMERKM